MDRETRRSFVAKYTVTTGALAGLAGCSGNGGNNSDGESSTDGSSEGSSGASNQGSESSNDSTSTQTLKIAAGGPLSGPFAIVGEKNLNGVKLAAKEINASDSPVEIEVTSFDTEASVETAISRAREAVEQHNVDVIVGLGSSSVALALSEFVRKQDVLLVTTAPGDMRYTTEECSKHVFRTHENLKQMISALAIATEELSSGTKIAGILPDYSYGRNAWDWYQQEMERLVDGVEFVNEVFPQFAQGDYQNEIQQTINADPDIVFTSMWAGDVVSFVQQAHDYDFFDQIGDYVVGGWEPIDMAKTLGDDMPRAITETYYYFDYPDSPENREFVSNYRDEYGEIPMHTAGEGYAAINGLEIAAKNEGTETDALISGLEGLEWEAPEGTKKLRAADHQVIEEEIKVGRLGPVDGLDHYGFSELVPVDGAQVTPDANCTFE